MWYDKLVEQDRVPDFLLRRGIRGLLKQRLADEHKGSVEAQQKHLMNLIAQLKASPIAVTVGMSLWERLGIAGFCHHQHKLTACIISMQAVVLRSGSYVVRPAPRLHPAG